MTGPDVSHGEGRQRRRSLSLMDWTVLLLCGFLLLFRVSTAWSVVSQQGWPGQASEAGVAGAVASSLAFVINARLIWIERGSAPQMISPFLMFLWFPSLAEAIVNWRHEPSDGHWETLIGASVLVLACLVIFFAERWSARRQAKLDDEGGRK